MNNNGIVNIHGKDYMTVARRLELAHDDQALEGIETEILSHDPVVIRAKVTIKGKLFTGISSVNLDSTRQIEKQNPYEVAETSAVGRALGFAGYGLIESVASADEMIKAMSKEKIAHLAKDKSCAVCGEAVIEKRGITRAGKPFHALFCVTQDKSHVQWLTD